MFQVFGFWFLGHCEEERRSNWVIARRNDEATGSLRGGTTKQLGHCGEERRSNWVIARRNDEATGFWQFTDLTPDLPIKNRDRLSPWKKVRGDYTREIFLNRINCQLLICLVLSFKFLTFHKPHPQPLSLKKERGDYTREIFLNRLNYQLHITLQTLQPLQSHQTHQSLQSLQSQQKLIKE